MQADREVHALLRGKGRFTADVAVEGALHAEFVRATEAHARIRGIDIADAVARPGVVAVLTAAELDWLGGFPAGIQVAGVPPDALAAPRRPAIAGEVCRYVGELLAVVVADSRAAAVDAAEAVTVAYETLAAVVEPGVAAPAIYPDIPANCALRHRFGDHDAVAAALAAADRVVTCEVALPRVVPNAMEPQTIVAAFDPAGGRYTLWAPHQGINEIRRSLSPVLGVEPAQLDVRAEHVGGAFGARGPAYPEHAVLLAASRRLGRPIRWQATRLDMFQSEMHGRGTRVRGRLGLDAQGRFTAMAFDYVADLGAYVTPVGAQIHLKNPQAALTGVYAVPRAVLDVSLYLTNTVPTGPYRGAGRPDMAFALERLVDEAATALGMDRIALRRRNTIDVDRGPWTTPTGVTYDSGRYLDLLDRAAALARWDDAGERRRAAAARGRLHGIGCALFVEVAGGGAVPRDEAVLRAAVRNGALGVQAHVVGKSSGQGHAATLPKVVASALGCSPAEVDLVESAGDVPIAGSGSFGSRSLTAMGTALVDAARRMRSELLAVAAETYRRPVAAMTIVDGHVVADDAVLGSLAEVVAVATQGRGTLEARGEALRFSTFPSGCHIAEIEVDPETGAVALVAYTAIDDSGVVLDQTVVEGQIRGGVVQGIGEALSEAVVYGADDGQLLTASFVDYAMPRARDLPWIDVVDAGTPSPTNPLGAKGVGEAGTTGAPAAVANAVIDALRQAGATPIDMPFTPARVWSALQRRG